MSDSGSIPGRGNFRAFTLIELLVSMVVLSLLMVMLIQLTKATQQTWTYTVSKVEQFREAREAFETITRRLGEATLNTYWDYGYTTNAAGVKVPSTYIRQSELRFVCGPTTALGIATDTPAARPTQAIFFQAPLGAVSNTANYHGLSNLLNSRGYCIEFGNDGTTRPPFLSGVRIPPALRNRFRLLEFTEPSESFSLYSREAALNDPATATAAPTGGNAKYTDKTWFSENFGLPGDLLGKDGNPRPVHVLAENIVALIFLPKLSTQDQSPGGVPKYNDGSLAPYYLYDSTSTSNNNTTSPYRPGTGAVSDLNPKNQLPPVIQVTMVAVDEATFSRMQGAGAQAPDFSKGTPLFQTVGDTVNPANPGYAQDLQTLQTNLRSYRLNYRVFTTSVTLKAAKWSREQTN